MDRNQIASLGMMKIEDVPLVDKKLQQPVARAYSTEDRVDRAVSITQPPDSSNASLSKLTRLFLQRS